MKTQTRAHRRARSTRRNKKRKAHALLQLDAQLGSDHASEWAQREHFVRYNGITHLFEPTGDWTFERLRSAYVSMMRIEHMNNASRGVDLLGYLPSIPGPLDKPYNPSIYPSGLFRK